MTLNSIKDIKLHKEQKAGNCKNICIYFNKGLQQFKNLKKENKKVEAWWKSVLEIRLAVIIKYL